MICARWFSNPALSGTATLTGTTATAAGAYQYYELSGPVPLPPSGRVNDLFTYGPSVADITGATLYNIHTFGTSTVNFHSGNVIGAYGDGYMEANDNSVINFSGGTIVNGGAGNNATFNFSGGTVENYFSTGGSSRINFTGGSVGGDGFAATEHTAITMSGGGIINLYAKNFTTLSMSAGNIGDLETLDSATADISSGRVSELDANGAGTDTLSGGTFDFLNVEGSGPVNVTGGVFSTIDTAGSGILNLYGYGLTKTPTSAPSVFQLTGTLKNGNPLNTTYTDYGGALNLINSTPVPEASSVVSLGLLLALGLGGWAARRKGM